MKAMDGDFATISDSQSENQNDKKISQNMSKNMPERGGHQNQTISLKNVIFVILRFTGILIFFAGLTAIVEWLLRKFLAH